MTAFGPARLVTFRNRLFSRGLCLSTAVAATVSGVWRFLLSIWLPPGPPEVARGHVAACELTLAHWPRPPTPTRRFNMRLAQIRFPNPVFVEHVDLISNTAHISGGGIHFSHIWDKGNDDPGLHLHYTLFRGNVAELGNGGGLFVSYTEQVHVVHSTFEGNKAEVEGGAVFLSRVGMVTLIE